MPYKRRTLSELREQNRTNLQSELDGVGPLLRNSNLRVLADIDAGMSHLHYGYIDYIALQTTPFTATDEYLVSWGAMKDVFRKPAMAATTEYKVTGTPGKTLPEGSILNRSDGYQYQTVSDVSIGADAFSIVPIIAILPAIDSENAGGGELGNAPVGTQLTLDSNVVGIDNAGTMVSAATGGTNIEAEDTFRDRILFAYQNPPQGGSDGDYKRWALEVPGITRAWVKRRIMGAGSLGIYIMCDGDDANNSGLPTGNDGLSTLEEWGAEKATGDQGRVADYIYPLQTDTALVWVCSPIQKPIDFIVKELNSNVVDEIKVAIDKIFFTEGNPLGNSKIYLSDITRAISSVSGTAGYILEKPTGNIELSIGELPVIGRFDLL